MSRRLLLLLAVNFLLTSSEISGQVSLVFPLTVQINPPLNVTACVPGNLMGFFAQENIPTPPQSGNQFSVIWEPGHGWLSVTGTVSTSTGLFATLRCTSGIGAGSISAAWTGAEFDGFYTFTSTVVDPQGISHTTIQNGSIRAIPTSVCQLSTPQVDVELPSTADKGQKYQLTAFVTNTGTCPIKGQLRWFESYDDASSFRSGSQAYGPVASGERVPVFQCGVAACLEFSRTWQWLPSTDPIEPLHKLADTAFSAATVQALEVFAHRIFGLRSSVIGLVHDLTELLNIVIVPTITQHTTDYTISSDYDLAESAGVLYAHKGPDVTRTVTLQVPDTSKSRFAAYKFDAINGVGSTITAVAAVVAGVRNPLFLAAPVPLLVAQKQFLDEASAEYTLAADPADSNFTEIVVPSPADIPELRAAPDGPWKRMAQTAITINSLIRAEEISLNRAVAAHDAGSPLWESRQASAASGFASDAAILATVLIGELKLLQPSLLMLTSTGSAVVLELQSVGLPPLEVQYLQHAGWSDHDLDQLRNASVAVAINALQQPSIAYLTQELSTFIVAAESANEFAKAITIRTNQLGEPIQPVDPVSLELLDTSRVAITASLQVGIPSTDLKNRISDFIATVQQQLQSTNNLPALQNDLFFGVLSLSALQGTDTSIAGLQRRLAALISSGAIHDREIAQSLNAKVTNAIRKSSSGDNITAANILVALENELAAQRGKAISQTAADSLIAYSAYLRTLL